MTFDFTQPSYGTAQIANQLLERIDEKIHDQIAQFFESFDDDVSRQEAAIIVMNAVCWHTGSHLPEPVQE